MDEDICRKHVGEKPKDVVSCVGDCTGTGWVYGNWGEVSQNISYNNYENTFINNSSAVLMVVVVCVNVQLNVIIHRICQHHPIIVYQILFLILNVVLNQRVINHIGIILHGRMYVFIILLLNVFNNLLFN